MKKYVLILAILGLAAFAIADTLWPDSVPIRQGVNIEWFRTGIDTNDGGAIYVWSDTKLGERDIWAQKVDAQGNMVWGEPVLIDGKPGRQEDPVITRTSDNNYIIAWIDFCYDLDGDVYAQKVSNSGELLWQEGGVPVCTVGGVQLTLNIENDIAGGAYIVWMDSRNPSKDLFGQRLSATGAPLWTVNGIPMADGIGTEIQNTMLPDGQGGVMFAYTHEYSSTQTIYVKRFMPDGTMAWPDKLLLASDPGNHGTVRMASIGNSEFILAWEYSPVEDPDIAAQKVTINGQLGWPETLIVYTDDNDEGINYPQNNLRIQGTSDNAAIVVWEDRRNNPQEPDLYAQKISSAGALLWNPNGLELAIEEFSQFGARMAAENSGGCYITWVDRRDENMEDIYAQHLSSSGAALWGANGKLVCGANNIQDGCLIKVAGNHVFVNWVDLRNGSDGLYYQVLNQAGDALLEEDGKLIFWGLSGDAPLGSYSILPRANDLVIIWQDTRYANLGYQIFFQFLNPDGSIALEENGRPVTLHSGNFQIEPAAAVSADGHIAVIWEDMRHEHPKLYMQLISPTGERLWGDTGMPLTQSSPINQKHAHIEYDQASDSFYVGWSNYDQYNPTTFFYHVWGQRIQNGQKMWGPDGKMISNFVPATMSDECTLNGLHDRFYVWQRFISSESTTSIYAQYVDLEGDPMPNWPDEGLPLSTYSDWDNAQRDPISALTDAGFFVMWMDGRVDFVSNYYGQHVSFEAEMLWNPEGVNIADYGREQQMATPLKNGSTNQITFAWGENIGGLHDIIAQRLTLDGTPLWGPMGTFVVQKDSTQSNPSFVAFPNGGMVVAWTDFLSLESDIYYRYIDPDGQLLGNPLGGVLCDAIKSQYDPMIATIGNEGYVLWADGRSSGKTEILGLFTQKISNITSANDDPVMPPTQGFLLRQNHPNPFNPSTTISFEIKDPARQYKLEIFNIRGQRVNTLHKGTLESGKHSIIWNGKDASGNEVGSGVYFYRLSDGKHHQSKKMLLMK